MRKFLLPLSIVLFAISAVSAYLARPGVEKTLSVAQPVIDFGELFQGDQAHARFELVNEGSDEIVIHDVRTSCACSTPELDVRELKPSEKALLQTDWKMGRRRGAVSARLTVVFSRKGQREEKELLLKARVTPDYTCAPELLFFDRSKKESQVIRFTARPNADVRWLRAWTDHRAFEARLDPDEGRVEVCFDPALLPEDLGRARVTVASTSDHEPEYSVDLVVRDPKGVRGGKP